MERSSGRPRREEESKDEGLMAEHVALEDERGEMVELESPKSR